MSCSGLANVLSGVALICGPRRTDLPGGSYRDQHGPPEVADGDDQQGVWRISYRPAPSVHLAWRKAGIDGSCPFSAAPGKVASPNPQRALSRRGGNWSSCPKPWKNAFAEYGGPTSAVRLW